MFMAVKLDILMLFIVLAFAQCQNFQSISQGVQGQVLWFEGNRMPGVGVDLPKGKPIEREIYFFEPTSNEQVTGSGPLYDEVNSRLIKKAKSNEEGYFQVKLPEGKYSVFVKENGKYYASVMDSQHFNPVKVEQGKVSEMSIRVDYKAYY